MRIKKRMGRSTMCARKFCGDFGIARKIADVAVHGGSISYATFDAFMVAAQPWFVSDTRHDDVCGHGHRDTFGDVVFQKGDTTITFVFSCCGIHPAMPARCGG